MDRADMEGYDVFCGIDVGKTKYYAVMLDRENEKPFLRRSVAQKESEIRELLAEAQSHEKVLVTVDQFGNIGRLVVAVAKDMGIDIAHITPRMFKKVAELYGEGKSDAKDAFVIADVSRSQPRHIRLVDDRDGRIEEVKALGSLRDDIVKERTMYYNRLHDLLQQICPPLEQLFKGEKLHCSFVVRLLERYDGPQGLRRAGKKRIMEWAGKIKYRKKHGPALVEEVFETLERLTVLLPATEIIEIQIKKIAKRILELEEEKKSSTLPLPSALR